MMSLNPSGLIAFTGDSSVDGIVYRLEESWENSGLNQFPFAVLLLRSVSGQLLLLLDSTNLLEVIISNICCQLPNQRLYLQSEIISSTVFHQSHLPISQLDLFLVARLFSQFFPMERKINCRGASSFSKHQQQIKSYLKVGMRVDEIFGQSCLTGWVSCQQRCQKLGFWRVEGLSHKRTHFQSSALQCEEFLLSASFQETFLKSLSGSSFQVGRILSFSPWELLLSRPLTISEQKTTECGCLMGVRVAGGGEKEAGGGKRR